MSERQEKKKRYNLRLMWIADFDKWLSAEPPIVVHSARTVIEEEDN